MLAWFRRRGAIGIMAQAAATGFLTGAALTLFGDAIIVRVDQWIILGLLTLSLSFVWGEAGIFSFGQSIFFGFAAYTYGAFAKNVLPSSGESLSASLGGVVVGTLVAALLGYFMFYGGVTDVYVAVITLAATLIMLILMGSAASTWHIGDVAFGGFNGMTGVPALQVGDAVLAGRDETYALIAVVAVAFTALKLFIRSPRGRIATSIGDNDERAELLGYDVRWYRWLVFVIGGAVASLAGVLFAASESIVTPQVFGMGIVGGVVISAMVGGRSLLLGGIVGAALIGYLTAYIDGFTFFGSRPFQNQTPLFLGLLLLGIVLVLPSGVVPAGAGALRYLSERVRHPAREQVLERATGNFVPRVRDLAEDSDPGRPLLEARGLSKSFGGLHAVNDVSFALFPGETRCLVGPNGAGKSTLFNLLVGRHAPDTGRVVVSGRDLTAQPVFRRIREGLGIKLQVPSIFGGLTVSENLFLAAYSGDRNEGDADRAVPGLLDWLSLSDQANLLAGSLSHGKQQWLEIGMLLATGPKIILLDEPTAGMSRLETDEMVGLVRALSEHAAVIVVEHDMEFVHKLDRPLTALVDGSILTEGSWDELRHDARLLDAYLGRG